MLFAVIYTNKSTLTEAADKRTLHLFTNWKVPHGFDFKSHYAFVDGSGGMALVEAGSAAVMFEAMVPWAPFLDFKVVPVIPIEDSVPIQERTNAWRDSVR